MTPVGRHYLFRNVDLALPLDRNVGVIGPNGAGKSTFLRLLGGADTPSSGTVVKTGRISPPMGLTPGLQSSLSARENVRFAGRIYGLKKTEIDDMISYVRNLACIGHYFDMPVHTYSSGMKQRIAFGINMSMNFDYYLFDEISAGGDREFKKTAKAMVAERLRTSRFVMTSHDIDELLELCHAGIVIKDGILTYFGDIRDAAVFYGEKSSSDYQSNVKRQLQTQGVNSTVASGTTESGVDTFHKRRKRSNRTERNSPLSLTMSSEDVRNVASSNQETVTGSGETARRRTRGDQSEIKKDRCTSPRSPLSAQTQFIAMDNKLQKNRRRRRKWQDGSANTTTTIKDTVHTKSAMLIAPIRPSKGT